MENSKKSSRIHAWVETIGFREGWLRATALRRTRILPRIMANGHYCLTSIFCFAAFAAWQLPLVAFEAEALCRFSGMPILC
ncbi:hypothetical protein [Pseudomonas mosselii]|uniref:hypothetical protein n=1 Tax=Pseudomonas mosselii TaxID=78327 RepID=UPI001BD5A0EE|nr:hypothetical protein [Pseudomonas mosselii]